VDEELRGVLVDCLQVSEEAVVPGATREEIGLDSLAVLELVVLLGERFGVEVHDYELLDTVTLAQVAQLVAERRSAG
jgi:acyl carrier protein